MGCHGKGLLSWPGLLIIAVTVILGLAGPAQAAPAELLVGAMDGWPLAPKGSEAFYVNPANLAFADSNYFHLAFEHSPETYSTQGRIAVTAVEPSGMGAGLGVWLDEEGELDGWRYGVAWSGKSRSAIGLAVNGSRGGKKPTCVAGTTLGLGGREFTLNAVSQFGSGDTGAPKHAANLAYQGNVLGWGVGVGVANGDVSDLAIGTRLLVDKASVVVIGVKDIVGKTVNSSVRFSHQFATWNATATVEWRDRTDTRMGLSLAMTL